MEALTFFSAMNRGQFREEQGIEGSSYCIFFAPMEELVTQDRMTGREAVSYTHLSGPWFPPVRTSIWWG